MGNYQNTLQWTDKSNHICECTTKRMLPDLMTGEPVHGRCFRVTLYVGLKAKCMIMRVFNIRLLAT